MGTKRINDEQRSEVSCAWKSEIAMHDEKNQKSLISLIVWRIVLDSCCCGHIFITAASSRLLRIVLTIEKKVEVEYTQRQVGLKMRCLSATLKWTKLSLRGASKPKAFCRLGTRRCYIGHFYFDGIKRGWKRISDTNKDWFTCSP